MDLQKTLDRAKIGIMSMKAIFLSTILFSLKFEWSRDFPTAATNGLFLKVNPDYWKTLTEPQRIGLLAHEAWHPALKHMERQIENELEQQLYNMAGDYFINYMLIHNNFQLPPNGLYDEKYDSNWTTNTIYDDLLKNKKKPPSDFTMDVIFNDKPSAEDKIEIDNILIKAKLASEKAGEDPGNIPEELRRYINELLNPKVPWNVHLQNYVNEFIKDDYSFSRPNKRFQPDWFLPTQYSEALTHISIAVDTSGSVTDEQFIEFLTEIQYIWDTLKPKKMTIIDFDTKIKAIHELQEGDTLLDIEFVGYGGTNIKPVIDWAIENEPTVFIIFTDGYFTKYEPDISFPLLWTIYDNPSYESKIGEVIYYE